MKLTFERQQERPEKKAIICSFSRRGFTLLEVMIALSILAIVLVAVYKLHAMSINMNISAKFYTIAPMLAQQKMAEFEIKPLEDVHNESGDFGENFEGYDWSLTVDDVNNDFLGSYAENLKKIQIRISYMEQFNYNFTTYRYFENKG